MWQLVLLAIAAEPRTPAVLPTPPIIRVVMLPDDNHSYTTPPGVSVATSSVTPAVLTFKICICSPLCVCGCNQGGPCTCLRSTVQPAVIYRSYQSYQQPSFAPYRSMQNCGPSG